MIRKCCFYTHRIYSHRSVEWPQFPSAFQESCIMVLHPGPIPHLHELMHEGLQFPPIIRRICIEENSPPHPQLSTLLISFADKKKIHNISLICFDSDCQTVEKSLRKTFSFDLQASCATGCLTTTPAGPTGCPTAPSACRVRGICLGTIRVGSLWMQLHSQPPLSC